VVHFFGFGSATVASYETLVARLKPQSKRGSIVAAAVVCGLGLGGLNETIEFLITRLPTENNVGGFTNTGWDLVANALGAITAAVILMRTQDPDRVESGT
jgi:hypothetical protein